MNVKNHLWSVLLFGVVSISAVFCLQCHVCNTATPGEDDCMEIASNNTVYLAECTAPYNASCRIQQQWVDFEVLGQKTGRRVVRQCASTPFDPDRPCYYRAGFGGKVNVCNCDKDGCNEASRTASTILMTIALFLIVKLLL